jgi:hypothetical protein
VAVSERGTIVVPITVTNSHTGHPDAVHGGRIFPRA